MFLLFELLYQCIFGSVKVRSFANVVEGVEITSASIYLWYLSNKLLKNPCAAVYFCGCTLQESFNPLVYGVITRWRCRSLDTSAVFHMIIGKIECTADGNSCIYLDYITRSLGTTVSFVSSYFMTVF